MPAGQENRREEARQNFLLNLGLSHRRLTPMAEDLSAVRRYFRLRDRAGEPVILMDDPQPGSAGAFVTIGRILRGAGLSAPAIRAGDIENGFLLLEDFGDRSFGALLRTGGADERLLYETATDVLIHLHRRIDPVDLRFSGLPHFNPARFTEQAMLFADLYVPVARNGEKLANDAREDLVSAWQEVLSVACTETPQSLLLRDYHVDNLMWLPLRTSWRRAGVLDFQDAGPGPCAYDLVSLLEDARRDVPDFLARAMQARYRSALSAIDWQKFMTSYNILGAQRHCRILGRFLDAAVTDGKRDKLPLLRRVMKLFRAKLALPELAPLAGWFDRHFDLDQPIPGLAQAAAPETAG